MKTLYIEQRDGESRKRGLDVYQLQFWPLECVCTYVCYMLTVDFLREEKKVLKELGMLQE